MSQADPLLQIFNPTPITDICGDDAETIQEFVSLFKEQLPEQLGELREACESCDFPEIKSRAHKVKGSASYFGAEVISHTANKIEVEAESENIEGCLSYLEHITQAYELVKAAIQETFPES